MHDGSHHARILVIAPQPFYTDRGTPIALGQVLKVLSERGEKVDLLTYPVGETIELPGLRIIRIRNPFHIRNVPIGFSIKKLLLDLVLIPSIWDRVRREPYQCIHAVEEAAFPALVLGRWYNVPVIYDMQSSLPEQLSMLPVFRTRFVQRTLRALERWLILGADIVVCSAGLEEYVRSVHPIARVWAWQFHSEGRAVSNEEIAQLRGELGITLASRVVLYTGNFAPYQGLSRLVDAASSVVKEIPNTVFVLVGGNSTDETVWGDEVSRLKERGVFRIVRRQPRTKLPNYLAMADVLVSPREASGNLPLKIFDYMAAGKPIVAVDSAAHRTVLNHGNAVLVGQSAERLSAAIVQLLKNPDEARRLGVAARAYSEAHLSWGAFSERVSRVYAQVQDRATGLT